MKKIILLIFIIIILSFNAYSKTTGVYNIDLEYKNEEIVLDNIEYTVSDENIEKSYGSYSILVYDYSGNIIEVFFFDFIKEYHYDFVSKDNSTVRGGRINITENKINLKIPYFDNATEIVVKDLDFEDALRIDIINYTKELPRKIDNDNKLKLESFDTNGEYENNNSNSKSESEKLKIIPIIISVSFVVVLLIVFFVVKRRMKVSV